MRSSLAKNQKKQEKRKQIIITIVSLFLVLLMILSVFAYYVGGSDPNSPRITEEGYTFTQIISGQEMYYQTTVNKHSTIFYVLPSQANLIANDAKVHDYINAPKLTIAYANITEDLAAIQIISTNLHDDFAVTGQLLVEGATQNNTFNVPVYGCVNSTPTIVVELANQTSITQKDGCLYVYTTGGIDTVSAFEKIRYIKYGILE